MEPLFPMRPQQGAMPAGVLTIEPYRHGEAWVFDDPATGLVREPFVAGVTEMIDRLAAAIPDAAGGFRLQFAVHPFPGHQTSLTWVRADPVEGNWYRSDDTGEEGWLCPALFCYFPTPPPKIFIRAEPRQTSRH
jgi:Family of unknown function (DUF6717)